MAYYADLTEVPNTGGEAFIFKIEGSVKGVWYVRIKRMNSTGYFKKTLKTTDYFEALKRGNRHWLQVREAEENRIVLQPKTNFKSLFPKYILHRRQKSTEYVVNALDRQFKMYYLDYFGDVNIGSITERDYIRYLNDHRLILSNFPTARKKPTIRTLAVEQQNFVSYLKWAYSQAHTRYPPRIGRLEKNLHWINNWKHVDTEKPERRDSISKETYAHIREYFRFQKNLRPRDTHEGIEALIARRRMHFYLISLYNFVCRAGKELLMLKFKDFKLMQSDVRPDAYYMTMTTRYGKKVSRGVARKGKVRPLTYYSDYDYPKSFNTWVSFLQEHGFPTGEDDWVFPVRKRVQRGNSDYHRGYKHYEEYDGDYIPWRSANVVAMLKYSKPKIVKYLESLDSKDDKQRVTARIREEIKMFSAYSVRHLAIRNLIVDSNYTLSRVAERANTGISMIEDFYYKYGVDPESRLVSKHPEPSFETTKNTDDNVVESLKSVISVKSAIDNKRRNYD